MTQWGIERESEHSWNNGWNDQRWKAKLAKIVLRIDWNLQERDTKYQRKIGILREWS